MIQESKNKLEEPLSIEEPLHMPARRTIFQSTAREDGSVDDFDEGTWRYFTFSEQSLAALRRRLQDETKHKDFVICRRGWRPRRRDEAVPCRPGPAARQQRDGVCPGLGAI